MTRLIDFLLSSAGTAVVLALLSWLPRRPIEAYITSRIRYVDDKELEAIKAQFVRERETALAEFRARIERDTSLHLAGHSSFIQAQQAGLERRLAAVDCLWKSVLEIREKTPGIVTISDILLENEYNHLRDKADIRAMSKGMTLDTVTDLFLGGNLAIECGRPYVGEYVWSLFSAYRTLHARTLYVLLRYVERETDLPWYRDTAIEGLLASLLSADELSDIKQRRFWKFGVLRNALELKMLIELDRIVSGEHFGRESIKQAHLIGQLSDTLRRDTEFEVAAAFKERQQK